MRTVILLSLIALPLAAQTPASWDTVATFDEPVMYLAIDTGSLAIVKTERQWFRSQDGMRSWQPLPAIPPGFWNSLWRIVIVNGVVLAGADSGLHRSTDSGRTWQPVPVRNSSGSVFGLAATAAGGIYYATWNGLYRSRDLGATWTRTALAADTVLKLAASPNGRFLCASIKPRGVPLDQDEGRVMCSSDGVTWRPRFSEWDGDLAVTDSGAVIASSAGGPTTVHEPRARPDSTRSLRANWPMTKWLAVAGDRVFGYGAGYRLFRLDAALTRWDTVTFTARYTLQTITGHTVSGGRLYLAVGTGTLMRQRPAGAEQLAARPMWTRIGTADRWDTISNNATGPVRSLAVEAGSLVMLNGDTNWLRSRNGMRSWERLQSGPPGNHDAGLSMVIVDGVVVAGRDSGLHRSTDSGRTWRPVAPQIRWTYRMVATPDGDIYHGGPQGLHRSRDRGATWSQTAVPASNALNIMVSPNGQFVCVRVRLRGVQYQHPGESRILCSRDGDAWQDRFTIIDGVMAVTNGGAVVAISTDNRTIVHEAGARPDITRTLDPAPIRFYWITAAGDQVLGYDGTSQRLYRLDPELRRWDPVAYPSSTPPGISGWSVNRDGRLTIALGTGTLVRLEPGLPPAATLGSVTALSPTTAIIAGTGGLIHRTEDGGVTWQRVQTQVDAYLDAVRFRGNVGIAVGNGGAVLRSANGGRTWRRISVPTTANLQGVASASATTWVAVGDSGAIIRSVDGGLTWRAVSRASDTRDLEDVCFAPAAPLARSVGLAVGRDQSVLWTNDGGLSWVQDTVVTLRLHRLVALCTGDDRFMIFGGQGLWSDTRDRGRTWAMNAIRQTDRAQYGAAFLDSLRGVVPTEGGALLSTADGGRTWEAGIQNLPPLMSVAWLGTNVIAVGDSGTIMRGSLQPSEYLGAQAGAVAVVPRAAPPQRLTLRSLGVTVQVTDSTRWTSRAQDIGGGTIADVVTGTRAGATFEFVVTPAGTLDCGTIMRQALASGARVVSDAAYAPAGLGQPVVELNGAGMFCMDFRGMARVVSLRLAPASRPQQESMRRLVEAIRDLRR